MIVTLYVSTVPFWAVFKIINSVVPESSGEMVIVCGDVYVTPFIFMIAVLSAVIAVTSIEETVLSTFTV